jgi:hypothetical protein
VTGFFVIEAYVGRLTEGGVAGGGGGVLLWDAALRQLAVVLERALEGARAAEEMLAVKDFLLLVATALERAGYQVRGVVGVWSLCVCVRWGEWVAGVMKLWPPGSSDICCA